MKAWLLLLIWLGLGVGLGVILAPLLGTSRAMLVPLGWCAGGIVGGVGGAIFTLRSKRKELRLKRTLSAAMGAVMAAVFAGAASRADLAIAGPTLWKALIALAAIAVIAPLCVLLSFWVNEVLE